MTKNELHEILASFKEKYEHILTPKANTVDLKKAYLKEESKRIFNLPTQYTVLAYVVKSHSFTEKYQTDEENKIIFTEGKPLIKPFDEDMKVIACLCLPEIRNTTFHEVYEAIKKSPPNTIIQGYDTKLISRIQNVLEEKEEFDVTNDSAFIFAASTTYKTEKRLNLHKKWLENILQNGEESLYKMDFEEMQLIETIFSARVLHQEPIAFQRNSYMFGKPHHQPVTKEFLKAKIKTYNENIKS